MGKLTINEQNYKEVIKALKDILYMYMELIIENGDFAERDLGDFDPYLYLDVINDTSFLTEGEHNLLRQGSAIALLSTIADVYLYESHEYDERIMPHFIKTGDLPKAVDDYYPQIKRTKTAFDEGRIINDPNIVKAFEAAFTNEDKFYDKLKIILENNIKNCFIDLSNFES